MAKKKYIHVLELGKPAKNTENCFIKEYNYGRTKDIRILVSKEGVQIKVSLGKEYSGEEMISYRGYHLFPDAIKKGLLIHILEYQNSMEIGTIKAWTGMADDTEALTECALPEDKDGFVQSLFTGKLKRPLYQTANNPWKNEEVLATLLSITKTSQEYRISSLYALLISKSKEHPGDRFVYLWMSFNGLYNYISSIVENKLSRDRNGRLRNRSDADSIADLMVITGLGSGRVARKNSEKIAREVICLVDKYSITNPITKITKDSLEKGEHRELNKSLEKIVRGEYQIDLSGYGYLLAYFAYFFRCNIIHASKPLPLFIYGNEYETRCLNIINQLLEDYLEVELPKYFQNSFVEDILTPEIQRLIYKKIIS